MIAIVALVSLAIGLAAGFGLGARRVQHVERQGARTEALLRARVLPVLSRRAAALGLPRPAGESSLEAALDAAGRIQAAEDQLALPFTDTLELQRAELGPPARRREG